MYWGTSVTIQGSLQLVYLLSGAMSLLLSPLLFMHVDHHYIPKIDLLVSPPFLISFRQVTTQICTL